MCKRRMQMSNFVLRLFLFPFLKLRVRKKSSPSPGTPEVVVSRGLCSKIKKGKPTKTSPFPLSPVIRM